LAGWKVSSADEQFNNICPPLIWLVVDDTELQMLHEGLKRAKPFADMSPELAEIERDLEARLATDIANLGVNHGDLCGMDR
jgi:hypothetical protein